MLSQRLTLPPPGSTLTRLIFPPVDDNLLKYNYDDNQRVEPEWYIPILPMVLVNGVEGIGTGWASKIPNYDVREVVSNLTRMLDGDEPLPMVSGPRSRGMVVGVETSAGQAVVLTCSKELLFVPLHRGQISPPLTGGRSSFLMIP